MHGNRLRSRKDELFPSSWNREIHPCLNWFGEDSSQFRRTVEGVKSKVDRLTGKLSPTFYSSSMIRGEIYTGKAAHFYGTDIL